MPGLTLAQMRAAFTRDNALDELLTTLESLGFNVSAWQSGSVQRTFLYGAAEVWYRLQFYMASLSYYCFNDTSEGAALTALSDSHYDNQRLTATYTAGLVDFTGGAVGPPYIVAIGDLVVADNINGYTYRNTTGGTIPASGSVTLTCQAEVTGTARNVANNTIDIMQTPLAGVTCNNPDPGTGTWITTLAIDDETDAILRARNTSKWGILSYAAPEEGYENMALRANAAIARVWVNDALAVTGFVSVYMAGSAGVVGAGPVADAQTEFDTYRPVTASVTGFASAAQAQAFTALVYVTTALYDGPGGTKETEIEAALATYINGLPIGGTVLPPGALGYMLFSELNEAVSAVAGVENITWTTPTADVLVTSTQIMTVGVVTFTYQTIN
jgi:phage-related baseplate assembly protein